MIVRMIGALMLVAGGAYAGCISAARLRTRAELPAAWIAALGLARAEITLKLTPMPELLRLLARRGGAVGAVFDEMAGQVLCIDAPPMAYIWTKSLEGMRGVLDSDAYEALSGLGAVLGRYDAEECAKSIDYVLTRLESCRTDAHAAHVREGRLHRRLGIALGAAAAILFF